MRDCDRHSFEPSHFKAAPNEAGLLLALLGRELASADGLIEGMLRAGLGVDAIAAYLGCARTNILDEISSRGIPIGLDQLEKPFRPRKSAWSLMDHTLFIVGWTRGVHVPAMAEVLGRSAGSLYGKRRRIGLPTRRVAKADERQKDKRPPKSAAASTAACFDRPEPATGDAKRTRRRTSSVKSATQTTQDTSQTLQAEPTLSSPPATPPVCHATEATTTAREARAPLQEELPVTADATTPTSGPSETRTSEPVDVAEKKARAPRQANPSTLSPETQPEWYAAVEDFMANRLPPDVDVVRHYGTKNHVITGVAILGGMKKTAIEEAAGFGHSGVNSHVDRLHLSSKGVKGDTFDRQQFDDAMKVLTPKADGVSHRLIFHAPGDHRIAVTVKRAAKRRSAANEARAGRIEAAKRKREQDAWAAGIEIRRGVSLRRLECLSRPFDMSM
jgi:Tfp pilus assembly major pilin PilA